MPLARGIVETLPVWHCTGTMSATEWRLLTTLPDLPSAQSLAQIMIDDGIAARVMSDASVLGQAAPSRIYVDATHLYRARSFMEQRQFTDEELESLATGEPAGGETPE
jgi:hypothetical protein